MIRSLVRSVLILLTAFGTTAALRAQTYALPAPTPGTPVSCDGCISVVKPLTPGYKLPIKIFTGRFLDSTWTPDYQCGFRTSRSGVITFSPDGKRVYMQMGSGVVAYSTATFFTQKLGQPIVSIENLGSALGINRVRTCGYFAENYLPWDKFSYFESRNSGFDFSNAMDGQDRLTGYDVDDRGNVYSAAFIYGWGIAHDDGGADGQLMSYVSQKTLANNQGMPADSIFAVKASGRYYAVVGAQRGAQAIVWDVTDATNPVSAGIRNIPLPDSIAHSAAGDRLAMVSQGELKIYTADGYINGASPIFRATPESGRSFGLGVTTDGSNFYAAETGSGLPIRFHTLAPQGLTYSDTSADTTEVFTSYHLNYNAGLLTLAGSGVSGSDIRVFRVISATNFRNVDLNNYIRDYYFAAPAGPYTAAKSQGKVFLSDAVTYKHANGKTYLILSAYGLGDVYELQTADGISASLKHFGETPNPNAPITASTTPFYGDKVVFSGTATAATPFPVTWTFGNPETADNSNLSSQSNVDVTHQFGGLTAAGLAGPKLVTVTSVVDPTVTGTLPLQLRMPTARVGLFSPGLPLAILGATLPANILTSDSFVDASDGAVEGHFSTWSIGPQAAPQVTQAIPSVPTPVGSCGASAMSMTAHYGPYVSTGTTLSTVLGPQGPVDFPLTVGPISYNAVPFIAFVNAPASSSTGDSVVFNGSLRITADTGAFVGTPSFTYHWDLMSAANISILSTTPVAAAGAVVAPFTVPNATIAANPGSIAKLTVSLDPTTLSTACAPFSTSVASGAPLNPPDPQVVATGCTATNIPCSLTAISMSGNESDWMPTGYTWTIDGSVQAAHTKTINPTLTESPAAVPHSITVTVTNSFTKATSAPKSISTSKPACSGVPNLNNVSMTFSGANSQCSTFSACTAGEPIAFFVRGGLVGYPFNDVCDKYTWDWDEGSGPVSDVRTPVHTFGGGKTSYNVSMTIDGGNGSLTLHTTVSFVSTPPPPPPATCTAPDRFNVRIVQRGLSSGCAQGTACNKGETINFDLAPQLGAFDFSCGNSQFSWGFGDNGSTAQGKSVNHAFLTAGTYNVTVQVSNTAGSTTLQVPVVVSDSGTPPPTSSCQAPSPINVGIVQLGASSHCSQGVACTKGENVSFDLAQQLSHFDFSCGNPQFSWDFDDNGATALSKSASHAFQSARTYNVTVKFSNGSGNVQLSAKVIVADGGNTPAEPIPAFSVSPDSPTVGQVVTFTNTNPSTRAAKWSWDFGGDEGSTSGPNKSVTHTYAKAGSYFVTLTESDSTGNTIGSKVQTVTVAVAETKKRRSSRH